MTDWKETINTELPKLTGGSAVPQPVVQQGSATAIATAVLAGTGPQLLSAVASSRYALNVQPDANSYVGIASNFNATTAALAYLPSGALFTEADYRGPLWAKTEGATAVFRVWGV